jgi:hypothetical protein
MKTILIVALLTALLGCSSPLEPSQTSGAGNNGVAIVSLSPASGPVGTRVVVRGTGLSSTANTVSFAALAVIGETPNEPSVIPGLPSTDGTIVFEVLATWRPACSYAPQACPFARIPTAPGTYRVTVTTAAGTSNGLTFAVTG